MSKEDILKRLVEVLVRDYWWRTAKKITETTTADDIDMDSLDVFEFIVVVEDEFEIEIPDEVFDTWKNLGDVVEWVHEKTQGKDK